VKHTANITEHFYYVVTYASQTKLAFLGHYPSGKTTIYLGIAAMSQLMTSQKHTLHTQSRGSCEFVNVKTIWSQNSVIETNEIIALAFAY
jgi:hypothetical protein